MIIFGSSLPDVCWLMWKNKKKLSRSDWNIAAVNNKTLFRIKVVTFFGIQTFLSRSVFLCTIEVLANESMNTLKLTNRKHDLNLLFSLSAQVSTKINLDSGIFCKKKINFKLDFLAKNWMTLKGFFLVVDVAELATIYTICNKYAKLVSY